MVTGASVRGVSGLLFAALGLGGCGVSDQSFNPPPVDAPFVAVSAGVLHTCGLTTTRRAYCWGWNRDGQLGDGSRRDRGLPVQVTGMLTFAALSSGGAHTCGITSADATYCWGFNLNGQLGDGSTARRLGPALVTGALTLAVIEIGGAFSCGAASDSTAHCWGWGEVGQRGDGTRTANAVTPSAVAGGLKLVAVSAGVHHACGLATDSTAHCWGQNSSGELGIGSQTDTTRPVPVSGGRKFTAVTAGFDHTCALESTGDAYCWGNNVIGQLGDTNVTVANQPNPVLGGIKFTMLSAGANHTCGLTLTGAVYCWGNGGTGQLGSLPEQFCATPAGNLGCTRTPALVGGGLSFATISAGTHHTCGVTVAQVAYCWGWNNNGQLGDGTTRLRVDPAPVGNQAATP